MDTSPSPLSLTSSAADAAALARTQELIAEAQGSLDAHVRESLRAALDDTLAALGAAGAAGPASTLSTASALEEYSTRVLPELALAPGADLAAILAAAEASLPAETEQHRERAHGHAHSCVCGEPDGEGFPELDTRLIPHAIRHATIFGALDSIAAPTASGRGLVITANHNPLPLLAQAGQRYQEGTFEVRYLAEGPEEWMLLFQRR
ncbi:DUF2249 domain-containing protein [Sinomonas terrae]|uniref:DUF2249 domain-containing protein n=1 Tax=Sinomonas terrae TaxID=2908838 RepID=A0ABS9U7K1_9MICC|nr:DUF2249 domain-containing protein [Sinomonas terrae]MCH6472511.1 DUF2249 domain-containing protein [Sinomonas terrae]